MEDYTPTGMLKSLYLVKNLNSNEAYFYFSISVHKCLLLKEHSENKNKLSVFGICTRTGNIRAVELVCVKYDVLCLEKILLSLELLSCQKTVKYKHPCSLSH